MIIIIKIKRGAGINNTLLYFILTRAQKVFEASSPSFTGKVH